MTLNKCVWKKLSGEYCNQSCVGKYCSTHNQRFKKGAPGVINCIKCNTILKGRTPLCMDCGGHRFREAFRYYKNKYGITIAVQDYVNGEFKNEKLSELKKQLKE